MSMHRPSYASQPNSCRSDRMFECPSNVPSIVPSIVLSTFLLQKLSLAISAKNSAVDSAKKPAVDVSTAEQLSAEPTAESQLLHAEISELRQAVQSSEGAKAALQQALDKISEREAMWPS